MEINVAVRRGAVPDFSDLRVGAYLASFNSRGVCCRTDFVSLAVRAAPGARVHLDAFGNRGRTVAARGKASREPDCIRVRICHGFLGGVRRLRRVGQRGWAISPAKQE